MGGIPHSCCFSGHRRLSKDENIAIALTDEINRLIGRGVRDFYSGGALGFDTVAAECVLKARTAHPEIRLILMLPCKDQAAHWRAADREKYERIKRAADRVEYACEEYDGDCMLKRNQLMVEASDICVCYLKAARSGTAYTVKYAKNRGLEIINLA